MSKIKTTSLVIIYGVILLGLFIPTLSQSITGFLYICVSIICLLAILFHFSSLDKYWFSPPLLYSVYQLVSVISEPQTIGLLIQKILMLLLFIFITWAVYQLNHYSGTN